MVTLEEAGAETIGTVIATINPPDQTEFSRQVDGLVRLGLVRKEESANVTDTSKVELVLTKQGRLALRV